MFSDPCTDRMDARRIPTPEQRVRTLNEAAKSLKLHHLAALRASDEQARVGDDIEAVHDLRVASRRLCALLTTFADWKPKRDHREALRRLKRIRRELGGCREWDVHVVNLGNLHDEAGASLEQAFFEHVLELACARAGRERSCVVASLDSVDVRGAASLIKRIEWRPQASPEDILGEAEQGLIRLTRRAFDPLVELRVEEDAEALHRTRLAIKRWRYVLEVLGSLLSWGDDELVQRAKALQNALGRHHDLVLLLGVFEKLSKRMTRDDRPSLSEGLSAARRRVGEKRRLEYEEFMRLTEDIHVDALQEAILNRIHKMKEGVLA